MRFRLLSAASGSSHSRPPRARRTRPDPFLRWTVTATREGLRPALELPYAITSVRPDSFAAIRRAGRG